MRFIIGCLVLVLSFHTAKAETMLSELAVNEHLALLLINLKIYNEELFYGRLVNLASTIHTTSEYMKTSRLPVRSESESQQISILRYQFDQFSVLQFKQIQEYQNQVQEFVAYLQRTALLCNAGMPFEKCGDKLLEIAALYEATGRLLNNINLKATEALQRHAEGLTGGQPLAEEAADMTMVLLQFENPILARSLEFEESYTQAYMLVTCGQFFLKTKTNSYSRN